MVRSGVWRRAAPGVVVSGHAPTTWHQRAMVATLATGGLLSHGSAARLHRFDGFRDFDTIHVVSDNSDRPRSCGSYRVHYSRTLTAADRHSIDGIPVTTVPITLIAVAASFAPPRLQQALDGVLRDGVSPLWIGQVLQRQRRRGLPGPAAVMEELTQRVDNRLPRSWYQRLAARLLLEAGLSFEDEHPVVDAAGRVLAELDLALPTLRIGVECQSWEWHATPAARQRDARRKRALRRLGWEIIELWWSDLDQFDDVLATVRHVIAERTPVLPEHTRA